MYMYVHVLHDIITCVQTSFYMLDHCRLLIETPSLEMLTPSLLLHCAVLHCHSLFRYEDVITTWLQRASILHDLCTAG